MSVVFPSLAVFLANRRIQPRLDGGFMEDSYDFGVHWRGKLRDRYRLTWIGPLGRDRASGAPGELYLLTLADFDALATRGAVEFLCVIPPVDGTRPHENVESILEGWAEVCGEPSSVEWIRDRVGEALRAGWARPAVLHVPHVYHSSAEPNLEVMDRETHRRLHEGLDPHEQSRRR